MARLFSKDLTTIIMSKLSIIIPCHNEAKNIPRLLQRVRELYREGLFELILVDNGSTDKTPSFLSGLKKEEYPFLKIVEEKRLGYGRAILTGFSCATSDILAWTHADLQTDPEDVLRAYDIYWKGDGKRVVKGRRSGRSFLDWLFTIGMSVVSSMVLGKVLHDVNAQPKLFGRDLYDLLIKNPPFDFSLDLYWMYLAKLHGYNILEIPVVFGKRRYGESKSAPNLKGKLKTSWRTFFYIFNLRRALK